MISRKRDFREGDYICRIFYQGKSKWKTISRLSGRCTFLPGEPWYIESVRMEGDIIKRFEPGDMVYHLSCADNLYVAASNQIFVHTLQKMLYYLGLRT